MSSFLRSPLLKWAFLGLAIVGAVVAVVANWADIELAVRGLHGAALAAGGLLSILYVGATMLSWRSIMADLGAPLGVRKASFLFFVTQIGKYIPGGIWNVVAIGQLGREWGIPRRSSFSGMLVFWLVSVASGLLVGTIYLLGAGAMGVTGTWLIWLLPVALIGVSPPVLRRLLRLALRVLRRDPLVREPTTVGLLAATSWALLGWLLAGAQVWVLASALSDLSNPSFATALGGYALAWTAGFIIVFAPAGAGVREVVLAGLFAGSMTTGAVVALVLLSRLLITGADFVLALVGSALRPQRRESTGVREPN